MRLQSPVSISTTTLCGIPSKPSPLPPPLRSPGFPLSKTTHQHSHSVLFFISLSSSMVSDGIEWQCSFPALSVPYHSLHLLHVFVYITSGTEKANMAFLSIITWPCSLCFFLFVLVAVKSSSSALLVKVWRVEVKTAAVFSPPLTFPSLSSAVVNSNGHVVHHLALC